MKMQGRKWLISIATLIPLVFLVTGLEAKKPIRPGAGEVLLIWDVSAHDGDNLPKETFDVVVRSGKETTIEIVVRHFQFESTFARDKTFYSGKDNTPLDGGICFAGWDWASGKYTLFDDEKRSVEFSTFPVFYTADGEEQKYHFYVTGTHTLASPFEETFPQGFEMYFDYLEITTEGKGQNRRRSCTDEYYDGFLAKGTFSVIVTE